MRRWILALVLCAITLLGSVLTSQVRQRDTSGGGGGINPGAQTCTNQFARAADAAGLWTCATVSLTADLTGTLPVANGGTGLTSGTSGGILAYTGVGTLASSGALTANLPVIGGGAGVAPSVGTRSGNSTQYVTTTGTLTSGDCVKIDANGNFIANGSACGGGGVAGADTQVQYNNSGAFAGSAMLAFNKSTVTPQLDFGVGSSGTSTTIRFGDSTNTDSAILQFNQWSNGTMNITGYRGDLKLNAGTSITLGQKVITGNKTTFSPIDPTINAGFCTSPSISSANGANVFTLTVGTSCTGVTTGTLTMPAANTGWVCSLHNITNVAANKPDQTGGTTTTVTVTNYSRTTGLATDFTASDVIRIMCLGY